MLHCSNYIGYISISLFLVYFFDWLYLFTVNVSGSDLELNSDSNSDDHDPHTKSIVIDEANAKMQEEGQDGVQVNIK